MNRNPEYSSPGVFAALFFSLSVRVLITLYWLSRFGGTWVEGDMARTTAAIQAVYDSGRLIPAQQRIYPNGFLYQVYVTVLARLTGWSVTDVQTWILPFAGVLLTLITFTFFMRILKHPAAAAVATVLLNLQGDYIIITTSGLHEKVDFMLIFVALLVLSLTLARISSVRERLALAVIYYLVIMAETLSNVFFASTFIVTLVFSLLLWVLLRWKNVGQHPAPTRLIYIVLTASIFVFLAIFVFYPPAANVLVTARGLAERLRLLFLSPTGPPAELYSLVNASWRIPYSWIFLRVYDLSLLAAAAIEWLVLVRQFRKGDLPAASNPDALWLLLLLPAFAIQNVAAVLSDITGSASQINNLQIRLIPLTAFVAAPLAALLLLDGIRRIRPTTRKTLLYASTAVVVLFVALALIKGVSEPLLSNDWFFYSPSEAAGIRWLDSSLPGASDTGKGPAPLVWAGPDSRLEQLWLTYYWGPNVAPIPITSDRSLPFNYIFLSPAVRLLTERYHQAIPDLRPADILYDNGSVQVYYLPPEPH